jgi:hypothetical protein
MKVTISFIVPCEIATSEVLNHMHMDQALLLIKKTAEEMLEVSALEDSYFDNVNLSHTLNPSDDPNEPVGIWLIEPDVNE